jgi:hypothetical protein
MIEWKNVSATEVLFVSVVLLGVAAVLWAGLQPFM